MKLKICLIAALTVVSITASNITNVQIDTSNVKEKVPDRFLSVTIDSVLIHANWSALALSSKKIQVLARALRPCYLRVGGTNADFLQFNVSVEKTDRQFNLSSNLFVNDKLKNLTFTVRQWDELNRFAELVEWDMIFDLNSLRRKDGQWLPDQAKEMMDHAAKKGYKIAGWELGNEPDVYYVIGYNINGIQRAKDYFILRNLLMQYPQYRNGIVIGPSVTMLGKDISRIYLNDFLQYGGPDVVTNPNFHHYYEPGSVMTVEKFMDPSILNNLPYQINIAKQMGPYPLYGRVWLGETSSAYGGGRQGMTDRYVAGFMWLDKLGISASLGVESVVRQTFYGGNYGLIDTTTLDPNPDYWMSYIYKILVGQSVFSVQTNDDYVRMYAHCTNTNRTGYKPGSITVYGMNLRNESTTITFPQFKSELHLYLLEPVGPEGLLSQTVALNGRTLELQPDLTFPKIDNPEVVKGRFIMPQQSFGFVVLPEAEVDLCL